MKSLKNHLCFSMFDMLLLQHIYILVLICLHVQIQIAVEIQTLKKSIFKIF
jgi:hypothetical protein